MSPQREMIQVGLSRMANCIGGGLTVPRLRKPITVLIMRPRPRTYDRDSMAVMQAVMQAVMHEVLLRLISADADRKRKPVA